MKRRRTPPNPRRRMPAQRPRTRQDPSLFVLTAQLALCGLLGLLCYAAADAKLPVLGEFGQQYRELVTAESVAPPDWNELFSLRDRAADTAGRWIATLAGDPPEAWPTQTAPEPTEVSTDGMGGWMGVPTVTERLPQGCVSYPILLSAAIQPPTGGRVTSEYGFRTHPITETADFHRGVDIAAVQGSPIRAVLPGKVSEVGVSKIYGKYITLTHAGGLRTTYSHCDEIVAVEGAHLRRGELVAKVGSTGISTGPHVHFELTKDGVYFDPAWVLDGMRQDGV